MSRKLVSIILPTWQRHELLAEYVRHVREQTYRPIEIVIVSDGPDPELRALIAEIQQEPPREDGEVAILFAECGRNWSTYLIDSFCAAPNVVAQLIARGEYQMISADDQRMEPDHIAGLVDALEERCADFAYSMVSMWFVDRPDHSWIIGADPPTCGQITNYLYKTSLLKKGLYQFGGGMISDWTTAQQWMQKGATWAFVPRVTLHHRADH